MLSHKQKNLTAALILIAAVCIKPKLAVPLFAAFIHELGHISVIALLRAELSNVTLTPFGAEISAALEPLSKKQRAAVFFFGPFSNLVSGFAAVLLGFSEFAICSHALAIANLLPIYPLDGGCVLLELLGARHKRLLDLLSGGALLILWLFAMLVLLFTGSVSLWLFSSYLLVIVFCKGRDK